MSVFGAYGTVGGHTRMGKPFKLLPHACWWSAVGAWCAFGIGALAAAEPAPRAAASTDKVPTLTLSEAVSFALEHNPELAAIRQQRGVAAAGVVIARTYP